MLNIYHQDNIKSFFTFYINLIIKNFFIIKILNANFQKS